MKVVTAVVNNPVFIEIQYHTLKKYLKGEQYEFIVFNDAKAFPDFTNDGDVTVRTKIAETCQSLGIQCISLLNEHHREMTSAAERCADAMKAILHYQLEHPVDKYLLLDSDMFLVAELDINKYSAYDCAVVLQTRPPNINYIWNGLYYFDFAKIKNKELLNWNQGRENNTDVGGMMHEWLARQVTVLPSTEDLRWAPPAQTFHQPAGAVASASASASAGAGAVYFIRHLWSGSWNEAELPAPLKPQSALLQFLKDDVRNAKANGNFYCEIYDHVFLHYRAGGNWNKEGMELHQKLAEKLKQILLA